MHVMFLHPNFPGQFGHIAGHLVSKLGWKATCVTSIDTTHLRLPFTHVNYRLRVGSESLLVSINPMTGNVSFNAPGDKLGPQPKVFYNPTSLDGMMEHLAGVYRALKSLDQLKPDLIQPDLVVGHMSYGTMLYLKNLYRCPFVGYFEFLPPPFWSEELVWRKEFPPPEGVRLFNAVYHSLTYLHLHACEAGYTPTHFQYTTAPRELRYKLKVIFDGVDTELFKRRDISRPVAFHGRTIDANTRVVTYVSRGLESARGFDIFMKMAKRIYQAIPNVVFLIAGEERTNYGHDTHHIPKGMTFKQWVLSQDNYDLSKFHFMGRIPPTDLPTLYSLGDVHVYLTAPCVLSWSMVQAMSTASVVVGSATPPVQEAIDHGVHGLLAPLEDPEALAALAIQVLQKPGDYRHLGEKARERVLERYEKDRCINQLVELFQSVAGGKLPAPPGLAPDPDQVTPP